MGKSISTREELDKHIETQKSIVFQNVKEASNFQSKHGSKIHKITEVECHRAKMFRGDKEDNYFLYSSMMNQAEWIII